MTLKIYSFRLKPEHAKKLARLKKSRKKRSKAEVVRTMIENEKETNESPNPTK